MRNLQYRTVQYLTERSLGHFFNYEMNIEPCPTQGQTYAVPDFVEMSEDWVLRRMKLQSGDTSDDSAMVIDPNLDVDKELDRAITSSTLVNILPVSDKIPAVQAWEEWKWHEFISLFVCLSL